MRGNFWVAPIEIKEWFLKSFGHLNYTKCSTYAYKLKEPRDVK